jgi:hypothetical protein
MAPSSLMKLPTPITFTTHKLISGPMRGDNQDERAASIWMRMGRG